MRLGLTFRIHVRFGVIAVDRGILVEPLPEYEGEPHKLGDGPFRDESERLRPYIAIGNEGEEVGVAHGLCPLRENGSKVIPQTPMKRRAGHALQHVILLFA